MNSGTRRPGTVRERFEGHLPEYGTLWRALAAADKKKKAGRPPTENNGHSSSTNDNNAGGASSDKSVPSLLPAILGGKAVSLRVPRQRNRNHGEDCDVLGCVGGCAEPIFEDDVDVGSNDGVTSTNDAARDDTLSGDDSDVVVVETPPLPNNTKPTSKDDGDGSVSASLSVSSSSSSSVAISRPPRRNTRRNIHVPSAASTSGWQRRPDGILSSSDDDLFHGDTTSEEEWIDGDGESDDDKVRRSSASNFATPTPKTTANNVAAKEVKEDDREEVIILSDDTDDAEDFNTAASESIDDSSEYAEDSFVVSDGDSDSSSNDGGSSDDDVQVVSPTINTKKKGGAAPPKGKKMKKKAPAPQPPRKQKTKSQPQKRDVSRTTFARKREQYTTSTFDEFNTKVFNGSLSSVEVVWSRRLNTTAGLTRLKRIGTSDTTRRIATIELSTKILDNLERLRATLLHEMCHAAAWLVDGVHKPPHGKVFKKWANLSMRRIQDVEVTTTHDYVIRFKFAWKCQNAACGSIIKRHSRSVDPNKHCCGSCKGRLTEIEVPGSKNDVATVGHTPKKKRAPTGFSLFVQKNSKAVRERLVAERGSSVTQPEVMKECGRMWREKKQELEKKKDERGSSSNNKAEQEDETNDENLPYDLNKAINDMESRLNGLTM